MFNLRELLQPLKGAATSVKDKLIDLQDKAGEAITGSYEVTKLNDDTNYVTDKPNILERIGGQKTESYPVKKQEPLPFDTTVPAMSYDTGREFTPGEIEEPRKEGLLSKLRDKVGDVFDSGEQQATVAQVVDEPEPMQEDTTTTPEPESTIDLPEIKDEHKEPIIKSAKEVGVDPTIIAKVLRGEGLYSTEDQLKAAYKKEGAIGPGQHRQIFYDEWNPKFKQRYGRDYDRKDLSDVATVASMAIKHYMDKYDSLDAALVAYNKGESVVQDYIDDPDVDLSEDPYVIGFKNR